MLLMFIGDPNLALFEYYQVTFAAFPSVSIRTFWSQHIIYMTAVPRDYNGAEIIASLSDANIITS
jgi:hypothetical protein